jgi:predicted acylesterase/phospholipase RssA
VNPPCELLDRTWENRQPTPDSYPAPETTTAAGLHAAFSGGPPPPDVPGRPLNVLVLSGGGKYGSYTAGVLCGWTAGGTRPSFDVVTGISSGALTAVEAFLGPAYDDRMAAVYNTLRPSDLFRPRLLRGVLFGNGFATSQPLEQLIARELDDAAMAELRRAHCEGRRLFVATANVVSLRPAIWDLGAIATSGRPDADAVVRKILLAACSIPGYAPPVEFDVEVNGVRYRELHGDGGSIIQAFVRTANGLPPGSNVYVLTAGKIYRDPQTERPRPFKLLGATVSNSLYALYRDDVMTIYTLSEVTRSRFHLVAMPQDLAVRPGSMTFDTDELRQMFRVGYQTGVTGIPWRSTPPGSQPGETITPRTGLEFVVPCPPPAPPGQGG